MIRSYESNGVLTIRIDGERSHLEAKALCSLIGQVRGKGEAKGAIGQQNVRIVVDNEGTVGGQHTAVEEK